MYPYPGGTMRMRPQQGGMQMPPGMPMMAAPFGMQGNVGAMMNMNAMNALPMHQQSAMADAAGRSRSTDTRTGPAAYQPTAASDRASLTVYVGHISADVPDDIVKQLLMECGRVLKWTRTQEPVSQKLSPFGFCEFDTAQGVWRATRLLHDIALDNQALVVTCQDKARECLLRWQQERNAKAQAANPSLTPQDVLRHLELEEEGAKRSITKLVADAHIRMERDRARLKLLEQQSSEKVAASSGDKTLTKSVGDEPAQPDDPVTNTDVHSPGGVTGCAKAATDTETADADISGAQNNEEGATTTTKPSPARGSTKAASQSAKSTPWLTSDYRVSYREKDRELRCNQRQREREREFARRVREWQRTESVLTKERKKRREREAAKLSVSSSALERLIEGDMYGETSDGHRAKRRQGDERKLILEKEKVLDDIDRSEEAEELLLKSASDIHEVADVIVEAEEGEIGPTSPLSTNIGTQIHTDGTHIQADVTKVGTSAFSSNYDASHDAEFVPEGSTNIDKAKSLSDDVEGPKGNLLFGSRKIQLKMQRGRLSSVSAIGESSTGGAESNVAFPFGSGTDEDDLLFAAKHKPLTKLDTVSDLKNIEDKNEQLKKQKNAIHKIAQNVPSSKEEVFKYKVDFPLLEEGNVFEAKLRPWIAKRVTEFLGKEEEDLVDYVMNRMSQHPTAQEMFEELEEMIDTESQGFVIRMWRVLIFEQLRLLHSKET